MINKIIALCALSMLSLSLLGMEPNYFSVAPKEIQEHILTLTLDSNNIKQSIRQLHKLRSISKSLRDLVNQRFTIAYLAKSLGVTERAIALHITQVLKFNREQASKFLAKYPANKELDEKFINAATEDFQELEALLKLNADVNAHDSNDETALIHAVQNRRLGIVKLLLNAGADANNQDKDGKPTLLCAIDLGYKDIAELLLKHGANINAQDQQGQTALMSAAYWAYKAMVKLLLEYGADMSIRNSKGETVVDIVRERAKHAVLRAIEKSYREIENMLVAADSQHQRW